MQVVAFLRGREAYCAAQAAQDPAGPAATQGLLWGVLRVMAQHGGSLHTLPGAKATHDGSTAGAAPGCLDVRAWL